MGGNKRKTTLTIQTVNFLYAHLSLLLIGRGQERGIRPLQLQEVRDISPPAPPLGDWRGVRGGVRLICLDLGV